MEKRTVLITGIGGNVGQGILRNIRSVYPDIQLIGTNTIFFSAGNHWCDKVYEVPFAYENNYIETIKEICLTNSVHLIIPSTDYEVYYLSLHKQHLPAPVLASDAFAAKVFLDKYLTSVELVKRGIPFAKTILPSQYKNDFEQFIAKPRKGRGSRGLLINPLTINGLTDEEYLIQELAVGKEITTAFYVTRQKKLLGFVTMERSLENGTTSFCRVITEHDESLEVIVNKLIQEFDIVGSLNLQSIVKETGEIVPFEINARISGTNSIRGNFGFKDVIYGIDEWLLNKTLQNPVITKGLAVRVLMDVIYPDTASVEAVTTKSNSYLF